jgi:GAF domain-containing protein
MTARDGSGPILTRVSDTPDRAMRSAQSEAPPDGAALHGPVPNLGEIMGEVARGLQEEHGDVEATLQAITHSAVHSVPGTEQCGVSLVTDRRRIESRAPTGDLPREIDQLQQDLSEGPCMDAVFEQRTVRIEDIREEERWPRFREGAAERGLGSLLSFQLFVAGDNLGALNLYAGKPHSFGEESESVGLVFASHAAIALAGAQQEQRLRTAIASRDLIGQAKGILMERFRITADQAFRVLVGASSRTNRKLADIAEELCATGDLPDPASRSGRPR